MAFEPFEPQKLITVALAAVLLAPFGWIFCRMALHEPRPEAEVRARMLAQLQEQQRRDAATAAEGNITTVAVQEVEVIGFWDSTMSWLSFYPRRWAGVLGLLAVGCILLVILVSLFIPGGVEISITNPPAGAPGPPQ